MARRPTRLHVVRTERLTPRMIRVVLGGEELAAFPEAGHTDRYVRLVFPRPDVAYPDPLDLDEVRRTMPRNQWPATRTYTVRVFDVVARELTVDIVHHGDAGLAGPWAVAAQPGDRLSLLGPGGTYAPRYDADWHLLVGDEAALPAISVALERMPAAAPALVLLEVANAAERRPLPSTGDARVSWLYRCGGCDDQLLDAVRALEFPAGAVHAFVHGEAGLIRGLRRHLLMERGVDRDWLSISGYWRRGRDEDGFRADKAAQRQAAQPSPAVP